MKDTGKMIINMQTAMKHSPMARPTKATIAMENQKELASTIGPTENSIKGSGSMDSNTDQECGRAPKEIAMSESGKWERLMAMAFMSGSTETDTREISEIASNTAREPKNLQTEIYIKESTLEESQTAMGSITGSTVAISKEISKKD